MHVIKHTLLLIVNDRFLVYCIVYFNYKRVCKSLKDRCALQVELSSLKAGAKVIPFLLAPNVLKFIFKPNLNRYLNLNASISKSGCKGKQPF